MRKPALTFDAILAAVAVLSAGASACSKPDRATPEPPAEAPAAPPAPAPEPVTAAATARPEEGAAAVDAGIDVSPRRAREAPKGSGGQAACGATGCSADMRKGGK